MAFDHIISGMELLSFFFFLELLSNRQSECCQSSVDARLVMYSSSE